MPLNEETAEDRQKLPTHITRMRYGSGWGYVFKGGMYSNSRIPPEETMIFGKDGRRRLEFAEMPESERA